MINQKSMLPDTEPDDVRPLLKFLAEGSHWTAEKERVRKDLIELLERKNYTSFLSTQSHYGVSKVGKSFLYDVPLYKQGNLKPFRGKRIRIVCVKSGQHFERRYMAGVVGDTPPKLIVKKLVTKYEFPEFANNLKSIYQSPRFRVVEASPKLSLMSDLDKRKVVDLNGCEALLLDGRLGKAIATLNLKQDGSVEGKHMSWHPNVSKDYPSLRNAIEDLALNLRD